MDDPMYPNDGAFFQPTEPEEQVRERKKQQSKQIAGMELLRDLIAVYEKDIQQLKSVDSIPAADSLAPTEFQLAWTINQQLLAYVRGKKEYLESLLPSK